MKTILALVACLSVAGSAFAGSCCSDKKKEDKKDAPTTESHSLSAVLS